MARACMYGTRLKTEVKFDTHHNFLTIGSVSNGRKTHDMTAEASSMQQKLNKGNPLSRKLNKTLDIVCGNNFASFLIVIGEASNMQCKNQTLEDPHTQEALKALAEFYFENTLAA